MLDVARFVPDEVRPRIPFLTLLDKDGKVLRNQRTNELEDGSKLDLGKVKAFLQQSSPST